MQVTVDESGFPIVYYRWPQETADEDIENYLNHSSYLLANKLRHVIILDMRSFTSNTAKQRHMAADWLKTNDAALRLFRVGACTMVASPTAAHTMRSVYWQSPPPYPWEIAETRDAALAWAVAQLQKHGIAPPAKLPVIY